MSTTISRDRLEQLAEHIHELHALRMAQHTTMAKLIRGCVAKLEEPLPAFLGRERSQVREEKALALLHLQWLATQLEDEGALDLREPRITMRTQ